MNTHINLHISFDLMAFINGESGDEPVLIVFTGGTAEA